MKRSNIVCILILFIIVTEVNAIQISEELNQHEVKEGFLSIGNIGNGGLMDSAWPMYCHDVRHTGRSPYGKDGNFGVEKWRLKIGEILKSSPAIDENGTIYLGSGDWEFFAVYSNGIEKWRYKAGGAFQSSPAIAEDGTIYVGCDDSHFYAFYPNGSLKWRCSIGGGWVYSSPVIDENGTIYIASIENGIYAIYPDGTKKWNFKLGGWTYDSPALDENGIVYIGSHDGCLYAIYTNNGTLKWKY